MYTGPADTGAYKWIRGEGSRGIGEQEKGTREIREGNHLKKARGVIRKSNRVSRKE